MFTDIVKYPDIYLDAKVLLESSLSDNAHLRFQAFEGWFARPCEVTNYFINEVADLEAESNIDLNITYNASYYTDGVGFQTVERVRNLRLLSARGDNKWTYRLVEKIWEGNYPSTVAVDLESRDVFLVNITSSGLDLVLFGLLDESQFEAFALESNDRTPFRLKIGEQALMDFVDGAEGINNLRKNIIIELDCGIPIDVVMNVPSNHTSV